MAELSSTESIMPSMKATDQAVQTVSTNNETVVALLREISDHLARIENVNVKPASEESKCSTANELRMLFRM